jgi:hypothetical protein
LQTLKKQFAAIVRDSGHEVVRLYGPSGHEVVSTVLKSHQSDKWKVKFGTHWKTFVMINGFVAGNSLNFKFVNINESNIIKVIKKF